MIRELLRIATAEGRPAFATLTTFLILAFLGGCKSRVSKTGEEQPRVLPVRVIEVARQQSFQYSVSYFGRIEAVRQSALSFEISGRLTSILFDEGQPIDADQIIATLDTSLLEAELNVVKATRDAEVSVLERLLEGPRAETISAARATVKRLESDLQLAEAERQRAVEVYAGRSISKSELDRAVFRYKAASHALEEASEQLRELVSGTRAEDIAAQRNRVRAMDAEIEMLQVRIEKASLRAPFDGVCVERMLDEGATVSAGEPIIRMSDTEHLQARFAVPQENVATLSQNRFVTVGERKYPITQVLNTSEIDQSTRTVDVIIPLDPQTGFNTLSGEVCTIQIAKKVNQECFRLPLSALVPSVRGMWSCFRVVPETGAPETGAPRQFLLERSEVVVLHTDGESVIVAAGWPDRLRIVADGVHRLAAGMRVSITGPRK